MTIKTIYHKARSKRFAFETFKTYTQPNQIFFLNKTLVKLNFENPFRKVVANRPDLLIVGIYLEFRK